MMEFEGAKHWPLSLGDGTIEQIESAKKKRAEVLHKIGNLTLLTKKLNPKLSNGAWDKKREAILKHSALSLNRELQPAEQWNEAHIEKRTKELLEIARRIWPHA